MMEDIITSDDILGRIAVGPEGSILGTVVKLHIHKDQHKIMGITVDKGFMQPDLFIGTEYIQRFGVDAVLLRKVPKERFEHVPVVSEEGRIVGTVKEIAMEGGRVSTIRVIVKKGAFKSETLDIPVSKVREIGASVILKKGYEF